MWQKSYPESSRNILDVLMQQNYSLQVEVDGLQKTNKQSTAGEITLFETKFNLIVDFKEEFLLYFLNNWINSVLILYIIQIWKTIVPEDFSTFSIHVWLI